MEQDIDTLTSFSETRTQPFSKNRVVRVLDAIGNDLKATLEGMIGKVSNNADGLQLIRADAIAYFKLLESLSAVRDFDPETDITVDYGDTSDSVVVTVFVRPVDAVEKIYITVTVQ